MIPITRLSCGRLYPAVNHGNAALQRPLDVTLGYRRRAEHMRLPTDGIGSTQR